VTSDKELGHTGNSSLSRGSGFVILTYSPSTGFVVWLQGKNHTSVHSVEKLSHRALTLLLTHESILDTNLSPAISVQEPSKERLVIVVN